MKRKIISALLALILCLSLVVSVSAAGKAIDFVVDEFGFLTKSEAAELNGLAQEIYNTTGVGVFFVYTREDALRDYDVMGLTGGMTDYFVMIENEEYWNYLAGGKGNQLDSAQVELLRDIYDENPTYAGGVEDFLRAAWAMFPASGNAPGETASPAGDGFVYDEADLLSDGEEAALTRKLETISRANKAEIIIMTMASLNGGNMDSLVEYVYDSMGFGYGENRDGVLLLVCMQPREYRILSNGYAGVAIDTGDIEAIGDAIVSDLSGGNYAEAFDTFADECAYYLDGYVNGFPFDAGKSLAIALIIGIVAGVAVALILKGQLKSVRKQHQASAYVRDGSMHLTMSNDIFLYRNVTRTRKQTNTSSGSSGGTSRSVGGGSF